VNEHLTQAEWLKKYLKTSFTMATEDFPYDEGELFEMPESPEFSWGFFFNDENPGHYDDML
jgi:hypothetical protein